MKVIKMEEGGSWLDGMGSFDFEPVTYDANYLHLHYDFAFIMLCFLWMGFYPETRSLRLAS